MLQKITQKKHVHNFNNFFWCNILTFCEGGKYTTFYTGWRWLHRYIKERWKFCDSRLVLVAVESRKMRMRINVLSCELFLLSLFPSFLQKICMTPQKEWKWVGMYVHETKFDGKSRTSHKPYRQKYVEATLNNSSSLLFLLVRKRIMAWKASYIG